MSSDAQVPPKVFVSYSHDSPEHKGRVRGLSDRLRREGVDSNIDQYEQSPPEGWPRWMERQIEEADFVLVVCTENYERRYQGVEDPGRGLGGSWEGAILTQHLYEAQAKNTRFIPVLFSSRDAVHVPVVLRGATRYRVDTEEDYVRLYRHLTAQPEVQRPELGQRRVLPPLDSEPSPSTSEDEYSDAEQVIRRHCEREWQEDYTMRNYCTKQQREALAVLKRGRPQDVPEEVFISIRSKCAAEWPEDYGMRQYCEEQQFDSYRELEGESEEWVTRELMTVSLPSGVAGQSSEESSRALETQFIDALDREDYDRALLVLDAVMDALTRADHWTQAHADLLHAFGFALWNVGRPGESVSRGAQIRPRLESIQSLLHPRLRRLWSHLRELGDAEAVEPYAQAIGDLAFHTGDGFMLTRLYEIMEDGFREGLWTEHALHQLAADLGAARRGRGAEAGDPAFGPERIDALAVTGAAMLVELHGEDDLERYLGNALLFKDSLSHVQEQEWLRPESYAVVERALSRR